jgi:predicted anti-sigma-YlaC factor YlaD
VQLQPTDCARARESVSAQLDGELSELELDRVEAHLLICPECSAWANGVRDVTAQLRAAPLEEPATGRFVRPRFGRSWRISSAVAVASAAAVVATMFVGTGQRGQLGAPQVSGFVGVTGQHYVVSRLGRLADGVYLPVDSSQAGFRHV